MQTQCSDGQCAMPNGSANAACNQSSGNCAQKSDCDSGCPKTMLCDMTCMVKCAKKCLMKDKMKAQLDAKIGKKLDAAAEIAVDLFLDQWQHKAAHGEMRHGQEEKLMNLMKS